MSLTCDGVSVTYPDGRDQRTVLDDVHLSITASVAVMGPSGSGKSTLLRVLCGQQKPQRGAVLLDGVAVNAATGTSDPRFALIHQDYRLVDFLTVAENIELACELRGLRDGSTRARELLSAVGLADFHHRKPATLSGGEQQRVAIARALAVGPRVIMADEPTGALDKATGQDITQLLITAARQVDALLIVATHDESVAAAFSQRLHVQAHQVVQQGDLASC
jgi:ABC-type lipoprotein export system ATPase subunit